MSTTIKYEEKLARREARKAAKAAEKAETRAAVKAARKAGAPPKKRIIKTVKVNGFDFSELAG
jgi:hypothetical protein